jgi:predicted nucleotidyltransferase component of viral defense system
MSVSRAFLERCARDTGFRTSGIEKVVRLGALAGEIGSHGLLGQALALKGGTALNLGFGAPLRLSVDLDFNFVGASEREEALEQRPRIERSMADLARRLGYRVQSSADAFAGRKLFLNYDSVLGPVDRIEIDLNFLLRVPLSPIVRRELWQPSGLDRPSVGCVGTDELVIGKVCAFLDRCAARDVWDVANLADEARAAFDDTHFRSRFVALAATLDHSPAKYGKERLAERLTQTAIDSQLIPMLAGAPSIRADELLTNAWARVAPLLELSEAERQFIEQLESGSLRTELLFPDDSEEAARIARHPALLWKAHHAGEMWRRSPRSPAPQGEPFDGP